MPRAPLSLCFVVVAAAFVKHDSRTLQARVRSSTEQLDSTPTTKIRDLLKLWIKLNSKGTPSCAPSVHVASSLTAFQLAACMDGSESPHDFSSILQRVIPLAANTPSSSQRPEFNVERRVVMAAAYAGLDSFKERSADGYDAARALVMQLARTYAVKHRALHPRPSEAKQKSELVFLHISKAAGTSLCATAWHNVKLFGDVNFDGTSFGNCCREGDQATWMEGVGVVDELTCSEREAQKMNGFVERYLDNGGALCDGLVYGVAIRDPLERIVSHVNEMFRDTFNFNCDPSSSDLVMSVSYRCDLVDKRNFFRRLLAVATEECTNERMHDAVFVAGGGEVYDQLRLAVNHMRDTGGLRWAQLCGILSNYQARSLLGKSVGPEPFVPAHLSTDNQEDLAHDALQVLLRMSLVLVAEEVSEDYSAHLLTATLGWNYTEILHTRESDSPGYGSHLLFADDDLPQSELGELEKYNVADHQLHAHARAIAALDHRFFRDGAAAGVL